MKTTVYLVIQDTSIIIDSAIIPLVNERNKEANTPLVDGDTYEDLRLMKKSLEPIKGSGYFKNKNSIPYWILPFEYSESMIQQDGIEVLTREQITNYGWDIEDEG